MPLAGGIMQHGYQCGMIWGAALAAGAQAFRLLGPGPKAEAKAIIAAQGLVESFRVRNNTINCFEIIDTKMQTSMQIFKFLIKGGAFGCFRMAAGYAPAALRDINSTLSDMDFEAPSPPVSCAAMLAQKMGVSDMHTAMAAGLAGGIGLCGGACGALGAAIWIAAMKINRDKDGKDDFKNPKITEVVDRFMKCTEYKFKCFEIVGRLFEDISDHSDYLHNGGCSKIIETLAAE